MRRLSRVLSRGWAAERGSIAGRVNLIGIVVAALLILLWSVIPWCDRWMRQINPSYSGSTDIGQVAFVLVVSFLLCILVLGFLSSD